MRMTVIAWAMLAAGVAPGAALAQQRPVAPAPVQQQAAPISPQMLDAAKSVSAYQRGVTMQRNAATKLCDGGQVEYCATAERLNQDARPTAARARSTAP